MKRENKIALFFVTSLFFWFCFRTLAWATCDDPACEETGWHVCTPRNDPYSTIYCASTGMSYFTRLDTGSSCTTSYCTDDCEWTWYGEWNLPCGSCCFDDGGTPSWEGYYIRGQVRDYNNNWVNCDLPSGATGYTVDVQTGGNEECEWRYADGDFYFAKGLATYNDVIVSIDHIPAGNSCNPETGANWSFDYVATSTEYNADPAAAAYCDSLPTITGDGCVTTGLDLYGGCSRTYGHILNFNLGRTPSCAFPPAPVPTCVINPGLASATISWTDGDDSDGYANTYHPVLEENNVEIFGAYGYPTRSVTVEHLFDQSKAYDGTVMTMDACGNSTAANFTCIFPLGCDADCNIRADRCGTNLVGDDLDCAFLGTETKCRNPLCDAIDDEFDCTCPSDKNWFFDPSLGACPMGSVFYVPGASTNPDLDDIRPNYIVQQNYPTSSMQTVVLPWENYLSANLTPITSSMYEDDYNLFLMPYNIADVLTPVSSDHVNLVPSLVDYGFIWDRGSLPAGTYHPVYAPPDAWCCTCAAPTVVADSPANGAQINDFAAPINFSWSISDWGVDCTDTDTGHFWIYVTDVPSLLDDPAADPTTWGPDTSFATADEDDPLGSTKNSNPLQLVAKIDSRSTLSLSAVISSYPFVANDKKLYWAVYASNGCVDNNQNCYDMDFKSFQNVTSSGWYQSAVGDVYADGNLFDHLPSLGGLPPVAGDYFSETVNGSGPGFVFCRGMNTMDLSEYDPDATVVSNQGWFSTNDALDLTNEYDFAYFEEKFADSAVAYNSGTIADLGTEMGADTGKVLSRTGNLTIEGGTLSQDKSMVILVDGEVTITGDIELVADATGVGFMAIFASGKIILDEKVSLLEGVYVTDGIFDTCDEAACNSMANGDVVNLNAQGIFVANGGFSLERNTLVASVPSEVFTYRPEYLLFAPIDFWRLPQTWKELAP